MGYVPIIHKKVSLTSSQISNLNSSPIEIIPPPPVSAAISIVDAVAKLHYSSAYSTNLKIKLVPNSLVGGNTGQLYNSDILAETADRIEKFVTQEQGRLVKNDGISVEVESGDPSGGDSELDIYLSYRLIYDI